MIVYSVYRNGLELGIYESNLANALQYWGEKSNQENNYTLKKIVRDSFVWPERIK